MATVAGNNVHQLTVAGNIISLTLILEIKLTENKIDHPQTSPNAWNEWKSG